MSGEDSEKITSNEQKTLGRRGICLIFVIKQPENNAKIYANAAHVVLA